MDWEGQTVIDRAGEKVGTIKEVFYVEDSGRPEWALVKMGRLKGHTTLVPLTRANRVGKGVKIPYDKGKVDDAPAIEGDGDPSEQQVNAVYRHYGIPLSGNGQGNGSSAPAGSIQAPAATPQHESPPTQQQQQEQSSPPPQQQQSPPPPPQPPPQQQQQQQQSGGEVVSGSADLRDEPIGDLVKQVKGEASSIVSKEIKLAKAEVGEKAKEVGVGAGMFGGAGYMAHLAALGFMLTVIFALATAMQAWLAALIVTVVFAAAAGVLALSGKKKIQQAGPPVPQQAMESMKQTIDTVKEEAKWGLGQRRR
jgi:sporulation protein YlmC with PRC-barrel domain/uncharacterized membrane protein YqjE